MLKRLYVCLTLLTMVTSVTAADKMKPEEKAAYDKTKDIGPAIMAGKTHYLYPKSDTLLPYIFSTPKQFKKPGEKIPLVIFLHGIQIRGTRLENVERHGPPKLIKKGRDFPFALISPLCPNDGPYNKGPEAKRGTLFWWHYPTADKVKNIIDHELKRHPQLDPERIYITGLSMGGFGVYKLALKYPDFFAAAIPMAAHANIPIKTMDLKPLKNLPFWAFQGEKDRAVTLSEHQQTVDSLKKAGVDITFTVYPGVGHNCWGKAYDNPKLYEWMLKKRRK